MNGHATKQVRRDLRRAFGAEAIGVVNSHAESIADILKAIETQQLVMTRQDTALRELLANAIHLIETRADLHAAKHQAFVGRSFWGRLRWLMVGR